MKYRIFLLFGLIWIGLAGCSPRVQPVQPLQTDLVVLDEASAVGQTFVARFDGLSAFQVYLSPGQVGDGVIVLHLQSEPGLEHDLAAVEMPLRQVSQAKYYRFDFQPRSSSNQQYYYAWLEVEGAGSVQVGASAGSTYLDGAMYQQDKPRDGQLTFSLEYEAGKLAAGLGQELVRWTGVVGLSVLLYILPGWAFMGWLWEEWYHLFWGERLGLAAGLSLALYAVVMMLTDRIGLHLGDGYAWGMVILGIAGMMIKWLRNGGLLSKMRNLYLEVKNFFTNFGSKLPDVALVILIGLLFTTRWWAIREIEAPMWGDSVQHAVIAQLIVDNNGLFQDWSPYTPYGSLTVQHVFSEAVALFTWLSGLEAWKATLWVGQILNVLSILAIYPLAVKISSGNRWAGWAAILVAGLISQLPAFYVNWGRYAQMTGQVILPVVMYIAWVLLESKPEPSTPPKIGWKSLKQVGKQIDWGLVAVGGIGIAGMILAYFRTAYNFAIFIIALGLAWVIGHWRGRIYEWMLAGVKMVSLAFIGAILFLPWLVQMSNSLLVESMEVTSSGMGGLQAILSSYRETYQTTYSHYPKELIIIVGLGLIFSILRKRWMVVMVGFWTAGMILLPAGTLIGLPGADLVTHFSILIMLYIPIGIVVGWLVGQVIDWLWKMSIGVMRLAITCILVGASVWFAWQQRNISHPELFAMVTRPDIRAMQWIEKETAMDARFLVEGFRIYNGTSAVGSDAGWWVPLLTSRQNTMPPQYALLNEAPLEVDYSQQIVSLVAELETISLDSVEGLAVLCSHEINHIYIGQLQGLAGAGVTQLYSPEELRNQRGVDLVYHNDRVFIYKIHPETCLGDAQE